MIPKSLLVLCALGLGANFPAFAQSAAAPGSSGTLPEKVAPETDVGKSGGTLSDKLGATDGVIHPQGDVDPAMNRPAPATGSTPVIPPPGSPGGDPSVKPK